ncbi:Protein of unknown function (DUF2892) [Litoreibacter ponti]|uniref:Inner membrane protein YgaP-like transmembrane domain-containing protein n=1 Tax=Litoreibacter ponti TaxID=1510457 RepID=A0A2T6BEJ1_9RHOB|nr:DUF2892 domain-containing protein [Litoreibacter ponti]PTX54476.1 Protein of unknown function (DUF2892) [Litoreibacter ponti]
MTRNLGQFDRIARLILGAVLIALALMGTIGIWGYLGLIFVGTAVVNFCPIYRILGLKTCQDC